MVNLIRKKFTHYFIPHESNNFKAKVLQPTFLIYYLIIFFVFQLFLSSVKSNNAQILGYATNITVEKILFLVNEERTKRNLNPLVLSPELSAAATRKAHDMFTQNYWAHISPTGVTPWQFIKSSGYNYIYAGENLAKDFLFDEDVVEAWMNSPTHRANILKPEYKEIGLAVMNGKLNGEETTLVVQEFGARAGRMENEVVSTIPPNTYVMGELEKPKMVFIPFVITKRLSLLFVAFMLFVLSIDILYLWKKQIVRISGHSLAHIIFFASLLAAIGVSSVGAIL